MKICGIICELNPFHNGHEYIFRQAKEITKSDFLIAVMSGDFVQRGLPAICDKYSRTRMALLGGADLVLELPVMYSTASADYFALGAVSTLDSLRCVDFLCFGSETGDLYSLKKYVKNNFFDNEAHILSQGINNNIPNKAGNSYAKTMSNITGMEFSSNDMLGICYIKSLMMLNSYMEPVAVKRRGSGYLQDDIKDDSASAIRKRIVKQYDLEGYVPDYVSKILDGMLYDSYPVAIDDFSSQLFTRINTVIRNESRNIEKLTEYMDVSQNIEGRIKSHINSFSSYDTFINDIHSKEYTKSRVMRAMLHILLDIKKEDYDKEINNCVTPYARILGFKRSAAELLRTIKERSVIPVISKASDASRILDDEAYRIYKSDINAANIYEQAVAFKYNGVPTHEFSKNIIIL